MRSIGIIPPIILFHYVTLKLYFPLTFSPLQVKKELRGRRKGEY